MRLAITLFSFILFTIPLFSQDVALKNNLLYDATATPNIGLEIGLSKHISFDISGGYQPWNLGSDKSLKHWSLQPELRYWLFERFDGHYAGLHGSYMNYDFNGFNLPWGLEKELGYDGDAWGVGISYGYQLYLSPRWNMEFTIGGGYNRFEYTKYEFDQNGEQVGQGLFNRNYYGITKLGISIVYIIR